MRTSISAGSVRSRHRRSRRRARSPVQPDADLDFREKQFAMLSRKRSKPRARDAWHRCLREILRRGRDRIDSTAQRPPLERSADLDAVLRRRSTASAPHGSIVEERPRAGPRARAGVGARQPLTRVVLPSRPKFMWPSPSDRRGHLGSICFFCVPRGARERARHQFKRAMVYHGDTPISPEIAFVCS
jgi:hypothetical protein